MNNPLHDIGGIDIAAFAVTGILALIVTLVYLWWSEQSNRKLSFPGLHPSDKGIFNSYPGQAFWAPLKEWSESGGYGLGNLGEITKDGGLHQFLLDNHNKLGGIFSFYWGKELAVSIADPNLWKDVQTLFNRPVNQFILFEPLFGKSSLTYINLPLGRKYRQINDRFYSHSSISSYFQTFVQIGEEIVEKWKAASPEEHIPLRQHMLAVALKSIIRTSFCANHLTTNKEIFAMQQAYDIVIAL